MKRVRYNLSIAVFVLLRRGDEICMLRRSGTGWMDGFYSLPAGGLEEKETLSAAACREAREEIGVSISAANLRLAHSMHVWTEDRSWMGHFFTCSEWQGVPYLAEPDKHSELTWQHIANLPADTIPYVQQAIGQIISHHPYSEYGW
ncbi:NUDIX domain-containing protein [Rahnella sp. SAP-1]|jgi:8-oxo-dGTP pyrophosphatase MutT (NUDIX family)|uniref:NUDIX domain-containing protein n=1 Tax=Rouxiella aceris TaxID=2703884 RepID=A0A848MMF5_9GAMM|nr:NUDIX domain-containing protein [Rouxiella aceris]NMP27354.1 NUDIX domain-containing protein [Rouxiella aceris]